MLEDSYMVAVGKACREVGALFVLDCIASGTMWVNMRESLVDVLISAPQKGWSGPASTGLVMPGPRGVDCLGKTTSNSFSLNLKAWYNVMAAYLKGGHAYHATMATDSIAKMH